MSSVTTLARPYAKAAFALSQADDALARWDEMLVLASAIVGDEHVAALIESPKVTVLQVQDLITEAAGENFDDRFKGYISVLAENGRLSLIDEISSIYSKLRQQAERRLEVRVVSAVALEADQQERLRQALSKRFDAEIELNNEIDSSVIGGAVIYAGDQVIDGSLRGRLKKLEQSLAS